jgi:hydroxymethylglutaryl-CoA lyase
MSIPDKIKIVEVGPRDGLQNEKTIIPTDKKIEFINALSECGFEEIEVGAFVSPKWVPQMADSEEVFMKINRNPKTVYSALVPNEVGLEKAIKVKADKVAVFTAASETFTNKNINASIEESINRFIPVVKNSPVPVRGYVSTAFYCPYEGKVGTEKPLEVALRLIEIGCAEISIGDTIGKATESDVNELIDMFEKRIEFSKLSMHFHDTFGNAVNNALVSAQRGISIFDSSAGGIGGCPFAPGSSGNVSTQKLVELFKGRTGIDEQKLAQSTGLLTGLLIR